jgi:hypothetical protein
MQSSEAGFPLKGTAVVARTFSDARATAALAEAKRLGETNIDIRDLVRRKSAVSGPSG